MINFGQWLRNQVDRNDPIGDLARDFIYSRSRARTPDGVRESIEKYIHLTDDDPVGQALNHAVAEWGGTN